MPGEPWRLGAKRLQFLVLDVGRQRGGAGRTEIVSGHSHWTAL
ncbi:hypothetical protein [Azospirillum argentinense]